MWSLRNNTPYAAERNWLRDKQGVHHWLVAIKATFSLDASGKVALADEQPSPSLVAEYYGQPGTSSLRYDSDLLAVKPCTDVIANASAYAPRGGKVPMVIVSLRVAAMHKQLLVHGEREYSQAPELRTTEPRPFEVSAIRYERAFGGADMRDPDRRRHRFDARNPIGHGVASVERDLVGRPAHTIEYPRGDVRQVGPAGFGAIDVSWSPRRELAGTYDARWEATKRPLLADDYQELFASCAPGDQRLSERLRGGEPVELVNMTQGGVLRFVLPRIEFRLATVVAGTSEEHAPAVSTVLLEPERMRFSMVWQSSLRVPARNVDYLERTTIREAVSS